jgi:putative membrane protein
MHRIQSFTLATALAVAVTGASGASAQAPHSQDQQFVQKAAASGRMEVAHGKMAAAKASNPQVKAFGQALVKDHTAANQQLMAIAKKKNITIGEEGGASMRNQAAPAGGSVTGTTTDTKAGASRTAKSGTTGTTGASGGVPTTGEARDRQAANAPQAEPWMSATGAAFDRGFIDAQVKAHQEAIALFEQQATGGSDADLKAFAQKQLPGLRNHLKQAQDLQAKLPSTD